MWDQGSEELEGAPRNELFERVLQVCAHREESSGRRSEIRRTSGPAPFHEIAEVHFHEKFGASGIYALAAVPGAVDEAAIDALSEELRSRPEVSRASLDPYVPSIRRLQEDELLLLPRRLPVAS